MVLSFFKVFKYFRHASKLAQFTETCARSTPDCAVLLFILNLIGLGLGPQFVGILNDVLDSRYGAEAIRYSLLVIGMGKAWGAVHSFLAARSLNADLDQAAAAA